MAGRAKRADTKGPEHQDSHLAPEDRLNAMLQCALVEYSDHRQLISTLNSRLDRIVITYLSALFAFGGFLLGSNDPGVSIGRLAHLLDGDGLIRSLVIFLVALQGLLVLIVVNHIQTMYRSAKYTSTVLRPTIARASMLPLDSVLAFDIRREDIAVALAVNTRRAVIGAWITAATLIGCGLLFWLNRNTQVWLNWQQAIFVLAVVTNAWAIGHAMKSLAVWTDQAFDRWGKDTVLERRAAKYHATGVILGIVLFGTSAFLIPLLLNW